MQIKKVPLEYGWDWFLYSWKLVKPIHGNYLVLSLFYMTNLYFIRFIPYIGHFLACAALVSSQYGLFLAMKENENKPNLKTYFHYYFKAWKNPELKKVFLFKLVSSVLSYAFFILGTLQTKLTPLVFVALYIEVASIVCIYHVMHLILELKIPTELAIKNSILSLYKNVFAEHLYMVWSVIITLASSIPLFLAWPITAPAFMYSTHLKIKSLYDVNPNNNGQGDNSNTFAA